VTAAHCFDAYSNVRTTGLLTGDHDLTTGSDTIWAALYLLEKYIKHENYNPETNANDIALMKTREYIKFK
jgi:trypsin